MKILLPFYCQMSVVSKLLPALPTEQISTSATKKLSRKPLHQSETPKLGPANLKLVSESLTRTDNDLRSD